MTGARREPAPRPKKVKVRVAVAVSDEGEWAAYGADELSHDENMDHVVGLFDHGTTLLYYVLEAELPTPDPSHPRTIKLIVDPNG